MQTIAEGVESEKIYRGMAGRDCDIAQGFAISQPLPAAEFEQWHAQHGRRFSHFDRLDLVAHDPAGRAAAGF